MNTHQEINQQTGTGLWPVNVAGPIAFEDYRTAHQKIRAVHLRRIGIIAGPVLAGILVWTYASEGAVATLNGAFSVAAGLAVILIVSQFTYRSMFKSCPPVTQWQIKNNRVEKSCGNASRIIPFSQVTGCITSERSIAVLLDTGELEVIPRSGFQTQIEYDQVMKRVLSIEMQRNSPSISYTKTDRLESNTLNEQLEFSGSYNKHESKYFLDAIGRASGTSTRKSLAKLPLGLGAFLFVLNFGGAAFYQLKQVGHLGFDLFLRWDLWAISVIGPLGIYSLLQFFVIRRLRAPQTWKLSETTNRIENSSAGHLTTREMNDTVDLTVSPEGILFEFKDPVDVILIPQTCCHPNNKWKELISAAERMTSAQD